MAAAKEALSLEGNVRRAGAAGEIKEVGNVRIVSMLACASVKETGTLHSLDMFCRRALLIALVSLFPCVLSHQTFAASSSPFLLHMPTPS